MEPVGLDGQNDPFSRLNDPRIIMTLAMESFGPYGQNDPFSRSKDLQSRISMSFLLKFFMDFTIFFGYLEIQRHFCQNFSWTYVKTLDMEPVGPDGPNDPFSRSNNPQSSSPSFFVIVNSDTLVMEPVGPEDQYSLFSRSNEPRRRKVPHFVDFRVL
ncbi:hypothetical protein H5410_053012 [Solanum commersonii]|uniref:Uncharacterized protein n=1 Tax=Solanum commersonii TaxID=4109 RepID=A0A9J5X2C9_SOLCO|nr:hypothetical protein H5410_053012 [Solanum commersonii]